MVPGTQDNLRRANVEIFAQLYQEYLECADDIQEVVRDMLAIVNDPEADADEKEMALDTMVEALLPQYDQQRGLLRSKISARNTTKTSRSSQQPGRNSIVKKPRSQRIWLGSWKRRV